MAGADDQNWFLRHRVRPALMRSGRVSSPRSVLFSRRCGSPVSSNDATRLASAAEHRLAFEPRHRLPDAAMDAGAEGHVPGGAAPDVERIGPVPAARVAVGGGEKQHHLLAVAEPARRRRRPPWSWSGRRSAPAPRSAILPRRRRGSAAGFSRSMRPLLGIARKAMQRIAEPIDRGVDARPKGTSAPACRLRPPSIRRHRRPQRSACPGRRAPAPRGCIST